MAVVITSENELRDSMAVDLERGSIEIDLALMGEHDFDEIKQMVQRAQH